MRSFQLKPFAFVTNSHLVLTLPLVPLNLINCSRAAAASWFASPNIHFAVLPFGIFCNEQIMPTLCDACNEVWNTDWSCLTWKGRLKASQQTMVFVRSKLLMNSCIKSKTTSIKWTASGQHWLVCWTRMSWRRQCDQPRTHAAWGRMERGFLAACDVINRHG